MPQIPVAGKVPYALFLLVVDPENVGGNHRNAARFHFAQLPLPILPAVTGVVKFAADGEPRRAVKREIFAVDLDPVPVRTDAAERQRLRCAGVLRQKNRFHRNLKSPFD